MRRKNGERKEEEWSGEVKGENVGERDMSGTIHFTTERNEGISEGEWDGKGRM